MGTDTSEVIESPTRGARERSTAWRSSPIKAFAVRSTAFITPIVAGWLAVRLLDSVFWQPDSTFGTVAWVVQALFVAISISIATERLTRRLLPLAFMLNQSLLFPDRAPARFGAALRSTSIGNVSRRIEEIQSQYGDRSEQEAAVASLTLVAALSRHDRFTRGHTERVKAFAELIAIELGLSEEDRNKLAWGVMLHDIGKLTVPEAILNKKSALTPEEWTILKGHPAASAKFLEPLEGWLGEWGRAALEHHERWDGNGYPNGLAGREISLAGRITAVADAYDVVTSTRSYKPALSGEAARRELVRCAGEQFDPIVVRAMLQVSLGKQRNFGFWSWLTEIPNLARLLSSVGTASSTAAVAVTAGFAVVVGGPTVETVDQVMAPSELAFADGSIATPTDQHSTSTTIARPHRSPSMVEPVTTSTPPTTTRQIFSIVTSSSTTAVGTAPTTEVPATQAPTTTVTTTTIAATTSTTTVAPTTTTTTTAVPAGPLTFTLKNPGTDSTASQTALPLVLDGTYDATLRNFDTDRNSDLGLTIKKDDDPLANPDKTVSQRWELTATDMIQLDRSVEMTIWVAAKDLTTGETLGVIASISMCDPTCTVLETATWSGGSTDGWSLAQLSFGTVTGSVPPGARLQLRVGAPDSFATTDLWFAYDATDYPSDLRVG